MGRPRSDSRPGVRGSAVGDAASPSAIADRAQLPLCQEVNPMQSSRLDTFQLFKKTGSRSTARPWATAPLCQPGAAWGLRLHDCLIECLPAEHILSICPAACPGPSDMLAYASICDFAKNPEYAKD